jgi:hypothetical protein
MVVCFVDKYVTCDLPDQTIDPELHELVCNVQQHSKNHSQSCRKTGTVKVHLQSRRDNGHAVIHAVGTQSCENGLLLYQ